MKALAPAGQSQLVIPRVKAALLPIALLLPLWAIGIFGRDYWKPDEPREADIVWRMHLSSDKAVPALGDTPFLEKPPLLYWVAAPFVHEHAPAWQARIPNLLYASIVALCVFLLAAELASTSGATIATLLTSSFLLNYQVSIWLATDAPLMAGVALSLLGLYRGYTASDTRTKLIYYTLMHAGLTLAFMAKSAAAWLVPGCTLLTLLVWDRNYRELLRWPLYAGAIIEVAGIGGWLWQVMHGPHGRELLQQLLWMNLAGRFVSLHSTAGVPDYTREHLNWFGKYLLEAPYFVFPWTLVVIATVRRGWRSLREGTRVAAWRFCVAATLPALALLSVSHTARDIYIAPLLIGVGLACGLWLDETAISTDRFDRFALRGTRWLLAAFGTLLLIGLPIAIYFARMESMALWPSVACVAIIAFALTRLLSASASSEPALNLYVAYMLMVLGLGFGYFPVLNREQDLTPIATQLRADLHGHPLVLVIPDETTRAVVDLEGLSAQRLTTFTSLARDAADMLDQQPETRFLLLLRDQRGPLSDWLARNGHGRAVKTNAAMAALDGTGLTIEKQYSVPDGRSYALLARQP